MLCKLWPASRWRYPPCHGLPVPLVRCLGSAGLLPTAGSGRAAAAVHPTSSSRTTQNHLSSTKPVQQAMLLLPWMHLSSAALPAYRHAVLLLACCSAMPGLQSGLSESGSDGGPGSTRLTENLHGTRVSCAQTGLLSPAGAMWRTNWRPDSVRGPSASWSCFSCLGCNEAGVGQREASHTAHHRLHLGLRVAHRRNPVAGPTSRTQPTGR